MNKEFWGDPIYSYSSNQGVEDGILFDLDLLRFYTTRPISETGKPALKYITTNLLSKGYWDLKPDGSEDKINMANLLDLLNQAYRVFAKMVKGDWFVSGVIELPSGAKQKIFIAQNETGRFTVMLPEDY